MEGIIAHALPQAKGSVAPPETLYFAPSTLAAESCTASSRWHCPSLAPLSMSAAEVATTPRGRPVAEKHPPCYHYSCVAWGKRMRRHMPGQSVGLRSKSMSPTLRTIDFRLGAPATILFEPSVRQG